VTGRFFISSSRDIPPGERVEILYGASWGERLETPQPAVVLRSATFEEYYAWLRAYAPDAKLNPFMSAEHAAAHGKRFYEVSTD
jgi:hypothetical protein